MLQKITPLLLFFALVCSAVLLLHFFKILIVDTPVLLVANAVLMAISWLAIYFQSIKIADKKMAGQVAFRSMLLIILIRFIAIGGGLFYYISNNKMPNLIATIAAIFVLYFVYLFLETNINTKLKKLDA
jgi:hypothetical protein